MVGRVATFYDIVGGRLLWVVGVVVKGGNSNGAGLLISVIGATTSRDLNGIIYVRGNSALACSIARGTELVSTSACKVSKCNRCFNVLTNVGSNGGSIARVFNSTALHVNDHGCSRLITFFREVAGVSSIRFVFAISTSGTRLPRGLFRVTRLYGW